MIQKMYQCALPVSNGFGWGGYVREYEVSAWMAEGSDTVNLRTRDGFGWSEDMTIPYHVPAVVSEKLSDYAAAGVRTMDDLIEFLFYVVKA